MADSGQRWARLHMALAWRRALLGGALLALVVLFLSSEPAHRGLLHALEAVEGMATEHPVWAAILVVAFTAVAATVAFVSSWLIVPVAVYTWGPLGALLLIWTGWLLSGAVCYAIAWRYGPPVVRWLGYGQALARYQKLVSSQTPFTLAVLFQLAVPSEVAGYLFGLGRFGFGRYLLCLGLAELLYGIATVWLGAGVVQRRMTIVVAVGSALVLLSVSAGYVLHRRLTRARANRDVTDAPLPVGSPP